MLLAISHLNPDFSSITKDSFAKIDTMDIPKEIFEIPNNNGDWVFDIAIWTTIIWKFEWVQNFHNHVRELSFKIKMIADEWVFIELQKGENNKLYRLDYDRDNKVYLIRNSHGLQKIRWTFTIESVGAIDNSVILMQELPSLIVTKTTTWVDAILDEEDDWEILV